jgi:hypothetical protein
MCYSGGTFPAAARGIVRGSHEPKHLRPDHRHAAAARHRDPRGSDRPRRLPPRRTCPACWPDSRAINSPLADQITGKSLVASKTPIVTLLVTAAAWASTKWGLGWSDAVDEAVAGFALLVASYVMRYVSTLPITGLFQKQSAPTATTIGTKT